MHIFLTGGRGEVGAPVLDALIRAGHVVSALARSDAASREMAARGATPVLGDLRYPGEWMPAAAAADAFIHAGATFTADDPIIDGGVVDALCAAATRRAQPLRVLYTGGCWLFGETGNVVADETSPFLAPQSFQWAVDHAARLVEASGIEAITIHPAMVYGDQAKGGVFERMIADAMSGGPIRIWGNGAIRWPVVHRADLANAYVLAVEKGVSGMELCVSAEVGVPLSGIADAIARRTGVTAPHAIVPRAQVLAESEWGEGPLLDQQMSGARIANTLGWHPRWTDVCGFIEHDMKISE